MLMRAKGSYTQGQSPCHNKRISRGREEDSRYRLSFCGDENKGTGTQVLSPCQHNGHKLNEKEFIQNPERSNHEEAAAYHYTNQMLLHLLPHRF